MNGITVRAITDRLFQQLPGELIAFEHTGGGVHVLFVGPVHEETGAWAVAVGPFASTGVVELGGQVYVGYDRGGELSRPDVARPHATVGGVVDDIVAQHAHICRVCGRYFDAPDRQAHEHWPLALVICRECALAEPRPELTSVRLAILAGAIAAEDYRRVQSLLPRYTHSVDMQVGVTVRLDLNAEAGQPLVRGSLELVTAGHSADVTEQWEWRLDASGHAAAYRTVLDPLTGRAELTGSALLTESDTVSFLAADPQ